MACLVQTDVASCSLLQLTNDMSKLSDGGCSVAGLLYMQHVHILCPRSLIMKLSFMCCCFVYTCSMPILLGACSVQYI